MANFLFFYLFFLWEFEEFITIGLTDTNRNSIIMVDIKIGYLGPPGTYSHEVSVIIYRRPF